VQFIGSLAHNFFCELSLNFFSRINQSADDELSSAFASADLFVMPSDSETLGFVVLEAMASGIPVVGVAAGGLVDIIQDGKTGYLVSNSEDMEEFSARTKQLIADREKRIEFGSNARAWSMLWSWETATSKLRNIQYRTAINLHKARCVVHGEHIGDIEEVLLERGNTYRPDLA
jgi:glycosyltransferase involved in cell wall biosynthesis